MKAVDLRKKAEGELREEVLALRKEEFNLRMQKGAGTLTSPARFKNIRKEIARIKTVLREMEVGAKV